MANNQKVDNGPDLPAFTAKSTETPDGQVQHVNIDSVTPSSSSAVASDQFTVTTSAQEIVPENSSRKGLILVNDDDEIIYLSFGGTAVVGRGVRLNSQGGVFTMDAYSFTTEEVSAITPSGTSNITIQEFQ